MSSTFNRDAILFIIRGVPGSGKTTTAELLASETEGFSVGCDECPVYYPEGVYEWSLERHERAYEWAVGEVAAAMQRGEKHIFFHEVCVSNERLEPFKVTAEEFGYSVIVLCAENHHGNHTVNGVPEDQVRQKADQLRSSIKLLP